MVDNVTANAGLGGAVFKTDEDTGASAHVPITKIELGANNSFDGYVSSSNPMPCGGPAAENAAVSGNPLLAGGRYDATPRTLGDGDVGAIALDADGAVHVSDGGNSLTVDGTVAATQSGTWNITNVSGTISLPTGAATAANQTTGNSSLSTIAGAVSGTEMQVDIVASLPAGTNAIGKLSANSGVDIGDVDVTSISAGSNLIGDVGISGARTSGGTTLYKNIDVDETEDQVKGTAGQVYWIHAINLKATPLYLKFYNATAASVVVGTTVPDLTFPVPSSGDTNGGGFTLAIPNGIAFSTAITIAATTGVADADTGAPGANELIVNLGYA